VKLAELRWISYEVPFRHVFKTAHDPWRRREGAFVRVVTDTGVAGAGEVAPLPSHGTLSLRDLLAALEREAPHLLGRDIDSLGDVDRLGTDAKLAPLRCALETAAVDAMARTEGMPAAVLLAGGAASRVRVHAVVDALRTWEAVDAAAQAVAKGFRTLKLKAGAEPTLAEEVTRVAAVRDAIGPGIRLRLDVNGAWSERGAIETLRALDGCAIDLVEQPVPARDIGALARVRSAVPQAIAADESVTGLDAARALIDQKAVDAIVLKLPVVGGPLQAMEIARLAHAAGVGVIVTSAFDAGIGVAAALHVAAATARPTVACGLATLELLEDDLIDPGLPVESGTMRLPSWPGLGTGIDEQALARYATTAESVIQA